MHKVALFHLLPAYGFQVGKGDGGATGVGAEIGAGPGLTGLEGPGGGGLHRWY